MRKFIDVFIKYDKNLVMKVIAENNDDQINKITNIDKKSSFKKIKDLPKEPNCNVNLISDNIDSNVESNLALLKSENKSIKPVFADPSGKRWRKARYFVILLTILAFLFVGLISFFAYLDIGLLRNIAIDQKTTYKNSKIEGPNTTYFINSKDLDEGYLNIKENYQYLDEVVCDCEDKLLNNEVNSAELQKIIDFVERDDLQMKIKLQLNVVEVNKLLIERVKALITNKIFYGLVAVGKSQLELDKLRIGVNDDPTIEYALEVNEELDNVPTNEIDYVLLPRINEINNRNYMKLVKDVVAKNIIWNFDSYKIYDGEEIRLNYFEALKIAKQNQDKSFKLVNGIPKMKINNIESLIFPSSIMLIDYKSKSGLGLINNEFLSDNFKFFKNVDKNSKLSLLNDIYFENKVEATGEGTFTKLVEDSRGGRVSVVEKNGQIDSFKIDEFSKSATTLKYGKIKNKSVLTFDDGPNPEATTKILDELKKANIKAVFFSVGQNVELYPEIARRTIDEGHEIANHSFTHKKMYTVSDKIIEDEMRKTNRIIEQVTGAKPRFFRLPFTDGGNLYNINQDLRIARIAKNLGMDLSDYDSDTKDYSDPNFKVDYDNLRGNQILLHDLPKKKGFELDQKLPLLIDNLRKNKVEIVDYKELFGEKRIPVDTKVAHSFFDDLLNNRFENMIFYKNGINYFVLNMFTYLLYFIFLLMMMRLVIVIIGKIVFRVKRKSIHAYTKPFVSIIIPAYNEEKLIRFTIQSVLDSDYPNIEIIMVDDGSKDSTFSVAKENFENNPKVKLFTKANAGKGHALNYGIKKSTSDYIFLVDADSLLHKDAISKMMQHFQDPEVVGVAGNVDVGNKIFSITKLNIPNFIVILQKIEYIYTNLFDKKGYSPINCTYIVPGCIGAFRKKEVEDIGMIRSDTLAEDMLLTIMLLEKKHKIVFEPDAYCQTEAPETLAQLYKQRLRWTFGTMQVIWKQKTMMFNPKHGILGLFVLPYILLSFFFRLIRPFLLVITALGVAKFVLVFDSNFTQVLSPENYVVLFIVSLEFCLIVYTLTQVNIKRNWILIIFIPIISFLSGLFNCAIAIHVLIRILKGGNVGWGVLNRKGSLVD